LVLAVGHKEFKDMGVEEIKSFGVDGAVLFDMKGIFDKKFVEARL